MSLSNEEFGLMGFLSLKQVPMVCQIDCIDRSYERTDHGSRRAFCSN